MPGNVTIHRSDIGGMVAVPPSKSEAQRAVACAVLAGGTSTIRNVPSCDDVEAALEMARRLGCGIRRSGAEVLLQPGVPHEPVVLHAGESGLAFRMFCAVAARFDVPVVITAEGSLCQRPMDMIPGALESLGARCRARGGRAPVEVRGPVAGGRVTVDGRRTSQLLSGLLIALTGCRNASEIYAPGLVSRPYVDMTISVLKQFGGDVSVSDDGEVFCIPGLQRTVGTEFTVSGDWSGAAALLVAGAIAGSVTVTGLDMDTCQADRSVLDALERSGAVVEVSGDTVTVSRGRLRAFHMDLTGCPDLAPALVVLATCCEGETILTGTARLRIKESDRAVELAGLMGALGGSVAVEADRISVCGGPLSGGAVSGAGDHRIVMAAALAGLVARGPVQIVGANAVSKSYPGFFRDLAAIGARMEGPGRETGAGKGGMTVQ